jgi:hypothetical protein
MIFRFMETILGLRAWKAGLSAKPATRLDQWFHSSFHRVLGMLPLYFDRIQAYSGPLYGFDSLHLFDKKLVNSNDIKYDCLDFLRRQEKAGGPLTAIAIVLDAVRANNLHVERGVSLVPTAEQSEGEQLDPRMAWPAVFQRSTMHLGSPPPRSSQRSDGGAGGGSAGILNTNMSSSQTSLLPNWNKPAMIGSTSSPRVKSSSSGGGGSSKGLSAQDLILLDYGPEPGLGEVKTWPHCDWRELSDVLNPRLCTSRTDYRIVDEILQVDNDQLAIAYSIPGGAEVKSGNAVVSLLDDFSSSIFSSSSAAAPPPPTSSMIANASIPNSAAATKTDGAKIPSTFHVAPLNPFLSLVVIVKGEEPRWHHRRKNLLSDDDIRDFCNNVARKLRVVELFGPKCLPPQDKKRAHLNLDKYDVVMRDNDDEAVNKDERAAPHELWSDDTIEVFLKEVKDYFGLRPVTFVQDNLLLGCNSPGRRFLRSPAPYGRPQRRVRLRSASQDESAAAYFLGMELARAVDD